jgi:phosphotriesterase-related protein
MAIARTVTGDVDPDELGVTLPHEHFLIDLRTYAEGEESAKTVVQRQKFDSEVTMENLWWMQYGRKPDWRSRDRYLLDDVDAAVEEAERFVAEGGGTVVDVTPMTPAVGRDPEALVHIARRTGLNVVAGTGHYIEQTHPDVVDEQSAEEIAAEIVTEVTEGIDGTGIRAGVIGEIGATEGVAERENELKSFRAAATAQAETGAPITVHPPVFSQEAHDVLDVLEGAGADLDNVIIGHLDATLRFDGAAEYYRSIADRGAYVEFDTIGRMGYAGERGLAFPVDEDRILELRSLFDDGYGDSVLVSMDICHKVHLTRYGGVGYDYLQRDVEPRLREHGFDDDELRRLFVENPAEALSFEPN